jgi:hypothetical protein
VTGLQIVLSALAAVIVVWLVVLIVRDRLPDDYLFGALAVLETGLLAQLVVGVLQVFGDTGDVNVAAYVGYLVGLVLVLPIAFLWSMGERTRSGTAVLLVGVVVVPVLFLRLDQLWSAR